MKWIHGVGPGVGVGVGMDLHGEGVRLAPDESLTPADLPQGTKRRIRPGAAGAISSTRSTCSALRMWRWSGVSSVRWETVPSEMASRTRCIVRVSTGRHAGFDAILAAVVGGALHDETTPPDNDDPAPASQSPSRQEGPEPSQSWIDHSTLPGGVDPCAAAVAGVLVTTLTGRDARASSLACSSATDRPTVAR